MFREYYLSSVDFNDIGNSLVDLNFPVLIYIARVRPSRYKRRREENYESTEFTMF